MCVRKLALSGGVAAAAGLLAAPGAALGASETFSDSFNLQLARPVLYASAALVDGDYSNNTYSESTLVTLSQFDTQGGTRTLESVGLNLQMTIAGELYVYAVPDLRVVTSLVQPAGATAHHDTEVELTGYASVGGLKAETDFDVLHGAGGSNYFLPIDESDDASDTGPASSDFIGTGDIDVYVSASVVVDYLDVINGGGNAGSANGIVADGTVELVYTYSTGDTGPTIPTDPGVIPTPAAAGLGLAMLGGLLGRRRR